MRSNFRRTVDRSKITHQGLGGAKANLFCFNFIWNDATRIKKAHLQQMGVVSFKRQRPPPQQQRIEIYGHHLKNGLPPKKKSFFSLRPTSVQDAASVFEIQVFAYTKFITFWKKNLLSARRSISEKNISIYITGKLVLFFFTSERTRN